MARVRDVLLVSTTSYAGSAEEFREHPPAGDPAVDLGHGLWLEQLPAGEADTLMDACEARGWDQVPARQFGQLYSLVRYDPPAPDYPEFDGDNTILAAVMLSRLIRPNPSCTEWALRVREEDEHTRYMPIGHGGAFLAFVPDRTRRNWLDRGEAEQLRELIERYWRSEGSLPERVEHALWLSEIISRQEWLDIGYPLVVTALEALIHTDREGSRQQFLRRVGALSEEIQGPNLDSHFLREAYEWRSSGVHGSRIAFEEDPAANAKFGTLQRLLQAAVRRAIEDPEFQSVFGEAETIRGRWPVSRPSR